MSIEFRLAQNSMHNRCMLCSICDLSRYAMSMVIMRVHQFPLVALQEHIPLIKVMFGKDVNVAFMGVILVFVGSVAPSIFVTLAFRRVIPWSI